MNERERVFAIIRGEKPDLVPWYADLDYWMAYLNAAGLMPEKYKDGGIHQLSRDLGAGFYLQGYFPFREVYDGVQVIRETSSDGRSRSARVVTPSGEIREMERWIPDSYCWAYDERFVKDGHDLKALRYLYEHTFYEPDYELAARRYGLIGDNGVVLCYLPKSPLMEMVALRAGIRAVTYALADAPDEFEETLAILEKKANEASEIALKSPAEFLMIPENLSSEVVGKNLYNKYVRPHDETWVKRIKEAGKSSLIHIDGTLRGLIREASETGFTILEAVTPAPAGDIEVEELCQWVAPGTVLWGGIPGAFFSPLVSDEDFDAFVIRVLKVMKSAPRYVLGVADQVPPNSRFERIARVRQLVEKYGQFR